MGVPELNGVRLRRTDGYANGQNADRECSENGDDVALQSSRHVDSLLLVVRLAGACSLLFTKRANRWNLPFS